MCLYARDLVFIDSFAHFGCSLATAIQDVHSVAAQSAIPLKQIFRTGYHFAKRDCRYTEPQFHALITNKMSFPHNLCKSVDELASVTQPPEKIAFTDLLSGGKEISETEFQSFKHLWTTLNFDSLLTCLFVYR